MLIFWVKKLVGANFFVFATLVHQEVDKSADTVFFRLATTGLAFEFIFVVVILFYFCYRYCGFSSFFVFVAILFCFFFYYYFVLLLF